jgi:hypothetical protein
LVRRVAALVVTGRLGTHRVASAATALVEHAARAGRRHEEPAALGIEFSQPETIVADGFSSASAVVASAQWSAPAAA